MQTLLIKTSYKLVGININFPRLIIIKFEKAFLFMHLCRHAIFPLYFHGYSGYDFILRRPEKYVPHGNADLWNQESTERITTHCAYPFWNLDTMFLSIHIHAHVFLLHLAWNSVFQHVFLCISSLTNSFIVLFAFLHHLNSSFYEVEPTVDRLKTGFFFQPTFEEGKSLNYK